LREENSGGEPFATPIPMGRASRLIWSEASCRLRPDGKASGIPTARCPPVGVPRPDPAPTSTAAGKLLMLSECPLLTSRGECSRWPAAPPGWVRAPKQHVEPRMAEQPRAGQPRGQQPPGGPVIPPPAADGELNPRRHQEELPRLLSTMNARWETPELERRRGVRGKPVGGVSVTPAPIPGAARTPDAPLAPRPAQPVRLPPVAPTGLRELPGPQAQAAAAGLDSVKPVPAHRARKGAGGDRTRFRHSARSGEVVLPEPALVTVREAAASWGRRPPDLAGPPLTRALLSGRSVGRSQATSGRIRLR